MSSSPPTSNSPLSVNLNSHSASSPTTGSIKSSRAASLEWQEDHSQRTFDTYRETTRSPIAGQVYPPLLHEDSNSSSHQLSHPTSDVGTDSGIDVPDDQPIKSGANSSVFVLAATTLGAGILALPFAYSDLGWLLGSLLLIIVGLTSSYSINLLLTTARAVGATTYEDLGDAIFPKFGKRLVVATTLILIFGSLTAFFVIIADTFTPAVQNIVGNSTSFFVRRESLLVVIAIVFIFPLCLLRSIHALERWSFLAVGIILAFSILIVVDSIIKLHNGTAGPDSDGNNPDFRRNIQPAFFDTAMFEALPIICLAFTCQTMIFPIWNNLRPDLVDGVEVNTGLASVGSMQKVANRSLLLCGCLYLPVGLFGFFAFGLHTKGDVLNNFPTHEPFYDVVRICFTLAIGIHYPVVHFGFRSAILTTWYAEFTDKQNRRRFFIITIGACLCSLILAIVLPDLSTVFGLTGSVCAFPYCFMFPTLFYLRLHSPNAKIQPIRMNPIDEDRQPMNTNDTLTVPTSVYEDETALSPSSPSRSESQSRTSIVLVDSLQSPTRLAGGRAYHPIASDQSQTSTGLASSSSPLIETRARLPLRRQIPAYTLLSVASILWIISIVVSFRDMINEFSK